MPYLRKVKVSKKQFKQSTSTHAEQLLASRRPPCCLVSPMPSTLLLFLLLLLLHYAIGRPPGPPSLWYRCRDSLSLSFSLSISLSHSLSAYAFLNLHPWMKYGSA